MTPVTRILHALEQGNARAASQLLPLIYDELRRSVAHKIDTRPSCSPATIHPPDFQEQVEQGTEPALELEEMLMTRLPEEIFAAEDEADWNEWVEFFSRTREADGRRKGLVEIVL